MLVMALEDYDEVTGKAAKAPIMLRDVVGRKPASHACDIGGGGASGHSTAQGGIDLPYISQLYGKPEEAIVAELGDLVYRDPETKSWQTADQYLSGNVRDKLRIAEAAGPAFARNAEALRNVQPRTCCPAISTPTWVSADNVSISRCSPPDCSAFPRLPSRSTIWSKTRCGASRPGTPPRRRSPPPLSTARSGPTAPGCRSCASN